MASSTSRKNIQRARKKSLAGQRRKRIARNKGTTPKFAIHQTPQSK